MKKILSFLGVALLGLCGCATTQTQTPPSPDTVHVQVTLPPGTSPIFSDRIAEAFTDEVRHVFIQSGYKRPVENILYVDDKTPLPNVLLIDLLEWHFDRAGNIECRFTARLETPRGTRNLGVYYGTSLGITRAPGPWGAADAFEEAAQGALVDLVRAIEKSDLLPKRVPTPIPAPGGAKIPV